MGEIVVEQKRPLFEPTGLLHPPPKVVIFDEKNQNQG
jgi:hypothetical protein